MLPRSGFLCGAARVILIGAALFAVVSCGGPRQVDPGPSEKPRLAVLVYFDQLRGDLPIRWQPLFEPGGFKRIATDGVWYQNCHYPHANTITGAGHATCATGCSPDVHGIVGNEWFDRKLGKTVPCALTDRYAQVPPAAKGLKSKAASPERLAAPSLGDAIKAATSGKARVVAVSLKERSSILPAGKSSPDLVLWTDAQGHFVTSTYYDRPFPEWVKTFNASGHIDRWKDTLWQKSRPDVDYVRWAGFDDVKGEADVYGMGRTFPHPFNTGKKGREDYLSAVGTSPMGNELLLEVARRAIAEEQLGQRETPDFLSISFSANDTVGHAFGPDSQEVLDMTLRSDVILRQLMDYLDEKVGKGKWVMALTADHGICQLPELARARGEEARRMPIAPLLRKAEQMLDGLFAAKGEKSDSSAKWIESSVSNMWYLNQKRIAARGVRQTDVETALAVWAGEQPGLLAGYTRTQLEGKIPQTDSLGRKLQRAYHRGVSGDVFFVLKPGHIFGYADGGTTHGSPHEYDTHVPLMIIGPGLTPGIRKDQRVSPEHAAVILAAALGIKPPARAAVEVPADLFAK